MKLQGGEILDKSGIIVTPLWPPITGTRTSRGSTPEIEAVKVDARTISSVVTPKSFFGSNTLYLFKTSAKIGTVELTGLEITRT